MNFVFQKVAIVTTILICYTAHSQTNSSTGAVDSTAHIQYYTELFGLPCGEDKATDNRGNGNDLLYGTRNFRTILHGAAYRGGGNNYYHETDKRNNKNPMPNDGLNNLADLKFSSAVYLYSTNFETAPVTTKGKEGNTLNYYQIGGNTQEEMREILEMVHTSITQPESGPVYLHCWNGWHQSGYVSAVVLRQFCGLSGDEAVYYWNNNTDTWNKGYARIKTAIRDFKPYDDLPISNSLKAAVCPCLDEMPELPTLDEDAQVKLQNTLSVKVPFAKNSSDITPGALTAIDEYIIVMKESPFLNVEIGGHSSAPGTSDLNQRLSEKRAKLVYDYIVSEGIEPERLSFKGYGEEKLLDFGNTETAHAKNRRIEFNVTSLNLEVQFLKNEYALPESSYSQLMLIAEVLKLNTNYSVEIQGHTDVSGDAYFNKNLSRLRAKSVYEYLIKTSVNESQLSYAGYGAEQPRYTNATEAGRKKNRRIEIKLNNQY